MSVQVYKSTIEDKRQAGKGLSEKEAEKRLKEYGPNLILEKKRISAFKILIKQFMDFMVFILLASTVISAFMGEVTEACTIIAIVIMNAVLGFIQEFRTEKTLKALRELAAPQARVVRDGREVSVPAEEVVPGDLIILETGDRVPADAVLLEAVNLQADEAILTGESLPVEKTAYSGETTPLSADVNNQVYMGTIITAGRAKAVVHATGMATEMGKIADMIQNVEEDETPLQQRLDRLGKYIVLGCFIICVMVSLVGILRGEEVFDMLLAGISLAVAAVPEGLPAIVTVALALGVQRMLKRNALIRKLPAVEALGCASVICSDKTGTLTENRMTVKKIYAGGLNVDVEGVGYRPEGGFLVNGAKIDPIKHDAVKLTLEIGALCNNAKLERVPVEPQGLLGGLKAAVARQKTWILKGDPTEGALLTAVSKAGISRETLEKEYMRIDELPFDSDRKCMSVVLKRNNYIYTMTKGAADIIIELCDKVYTPQGISPLTESMKKEVLRLNNRMAGEALRVLGLAYKRHQGKRYFKNEIEKGLTFVGLIGMIDPPRKEAFEAVRNCKLAGIKPVMITGDHKITATAIAKELGIYNEGDMVLTGNELEQMNETRLSRIIRNVSVYARVSPRHKLMIVRALKKLGHIVAMTGDGVNDAPAVKEADIGVSMGITGTDVTREASSMILLDDNFATIVAAVEEGRTIYSNIRKFIRYLLACNIGEVLTMFLGTLLGFPVPLLPIQILWVNLVTDGLPAIALGLEPPERDIMMRPPRSSKDNIFSDGLLKLILLRGTLLGISTLAVFASILHFTNNIALARSGAFVTLVLAQLTHVFECKSEKKTILDIPVFNNMYIVFAVICSLLMMLSVIYVPFLRPVFKTEILTLNEWLLIAGFTGLGPAVSTFTRRVR